MPDNFDRIVSDQLADYPYETGSVELQDEDGHLLLTLRYDRKPLKPGDPGYAVPVTIAGQKVLANLEFNLRGTTFTLNQSITDILSGLWGFKQSLASPKP